MAYNSPRRDDGSSPYLPPISSNHSYDRPAPSFSPNTYSRLFVSYQAHRSNYRVPVDSRDTTEFLRYPDLRDPVEREREKSRIRAEIMEEQMERRRILEEEVRMELLQEREMTLKRWEDSRMHSDAPSEFSQFGHESSLGLRYGAPETGNFAHEPSRQRFDRDPEIRQPVHDDESYRRRFDASFEDRPNVYEPSRVSQSSGHLQERRVHLLPTVDASFDARPNVYEPSRVSQSSGHLQERRLHLLPTVPGHPMPGRIYVPVKHLAVPTTHSLPLLSTPSNTFLRGSKPLQEPGKPRILLPNGGASASDPNRKRKASALEPVGRWSCKLCKINATSKKTLDEHLKGKKHKLVEELKSLPPYNSGLKSNPVKEEPSDKPGPTKAKSSETSNTDVAEKDKGKGKMIETSRADVAKVVTKQKAETMVDAKRTSKANASVRAQVPSMTLGSGGSVDKSKLYCKLCTVVSTSEIALASHLKGRRHLENLKKEKEKEKKKKKGNK